MVCSGFKAGHWFLENHADFLSTKFAEKSLGLVWFGYLVGGKLMLLAFWVMVACPVTLRLFVGKSPSMARLEMDLPEPDSPTMASVSPVWSV